LVSAAKAVFKPTDGKSMLFLPEEARCLVATAAARAAGHGSKTRSALLIVEALVDLCDLSDPTPALGVLQRQNFLVRPVKVISNIRYLLIEPL
jgi:hypothetical protein